MSTTYDFRASEYVEDEDVERLRDVWAHLTLLATGQEPRTSNAEAAVMLATAYYGIMGEEIQEPVTMHRNDDRATEKELAEALTAAWNAIACHRDNVPYVHPVHGTLTLEEVKYLILDPALEKHRNS